MEPILDTSSRYYARDSIENFKIRVSLKSLSSSQIIVAKTGEMKSNRNQQHCEDKIIKWQQKILSPSEKEEYSRSKYKNDSQFSHYHMLALSTSHDPENRIFTYTSHDTFTTKLVPTTTTTTPVEESYLRSRFKQKNTPGKVLTTAINSHICSFYIMAHFGSRDEGDEEEEKEFVLCEIHFKSTGELVIKPDFTKEEDEPYRVEGVGSDSKVFEYTLSNESPDFHRPPFKSLPQDSVDYATNPEFHSPEPDEIHIHLVGDIYRASSFYDTSGAIYIHYILVLPEGWSALSGTDLEGCTNASYGVLENNMFVFHCSAPLRFSLSRKLKGSGWPTLLFAVFSQEWLGYDRDQGYASVQLPQPGRHPNEPIVVNTWRPTPRTFEQYLTRYFLGGATLLKNSSYLNPQQNETNLISRLGLETESSGTLEFRTSCIIQNNVTDPNAEFLRTNLELSAMRPSTLAVIETFHKSFMKARKARMKKQKDI